VEVGSEQQQQQAKGAVALPRGGRSSRPRAVAPAQWRWQAVGSEQHQQAEGAAVLPREEHLPSTGRV
jgi:hypothetical protein